MTLNNDQIRGKGLIIHSANSSYKTASYDLRIDKIIDMNGEEQDFYKLPPQGMAYVIFKELVYLPNDVIGYAHVKTAITQKGIMATNIGIIDPGYQGPLSTLLINFGSSYETLTKGDSALRLTFQDINQSTNPSTTGKYDVERYLNERRKDTDNLSEKFLNLHSVKDEIFGRVVKTLIGLSIIFSAASFAIGMYFQNKTAADKDFEKHNKALEVSLEALRQEFKMYKQQQLDSVKRIVQQQINRKGGKSDGE